MAAFASRFVLETEGFLTVCLIGRVLAGNFFPFLKKKKGDNSIGKSEFLSPGKPAPLLHREAICQGPAQLTSKLHGH